jgi:rubrerythrin
VSGEATAARSASSPSLDVQMLQTQASLEALAVRAYQHALELPAIKALSVDSALKVFAATTLYQHRDHLGLFNQTVEALGGRPQTSPDPHYEPLLTSQLAQIEKMARASALAALIELSITLESVASDTYAKNGQAFAHRRARAATASVAGIEAQHVAALLTIQALQKSVPASALAFGPEASHALPASAGDVGCPSAFYQTNLASPPDEGTVR